MSGLTRKSGGRTVIDNVSLTIPRGGAFGLAGPGGAGKTTLIRLVLGLTPASSGSSACSGSPSRRSGAWRWARWVPWSGSLASTATSPAGKTSGSSPRPGSPEPTAGSSRPWSGWACASGPGTGSPPPPGLRRHLGLAACLLGDPELLILDQPRTGWNPAGIRQFRRLLRGFTDEGRTVLLSTRRLDEAERTCAAAAVLDQGGSSPRARSVSSSA